MDHKDIYHSLAEYKIQWTFNVEKSPWWSRVFDRLILSVKRCLKKIVGRATLMHEELLTVIMEIEMIINSRLLSYVTQDDLEEPITPHLLVGQRIISFPDYHCSNVDDNFTVTPQLRSRRMVFINHQLEQF